MASTPPDESATPDTEPGDLHDAPTMSVAHGATPITAVDDEGGLPRTAQAPEEGTRLGRYLVLRRVAHGGMGDVYEAYDPDLGRRVAIKLLRPRVDGETGRLRLVREAQALAQVSHPNVIPVYDVGTWRQTVFVAMELVEGDTVKHWLASGARTPRQILLVFAAAGRGLAATHRAGIIHRDVKPGNVMIGSDGRVRVLDFGLARAEARDSTLASTASMEAEPGDDDEGSASGQLLDTELTRHGDVVGTPAYMSPEQAAGRVVDARSDQFSFAVSLYRALWGRPPFPGRDIDAQHAAAAAGRVVVPPRGRVPRRARQAVLRALAADPVDRFATMDALVDRLEPGAASRRVLIAGAGAVTATAIAIAVVGRGGPARPLCEGLDTDVAAVWTAGDRVALASAFTASGRVHGAATAARVATTLDRYASGIVAMRGAACRATHEQGIQSAELLDLREHCLERRRLALGALVAVLRDQPSGDVVDDAAAAALDLPPIDACADTAALRDALPRPTAPLARAQASLIERELARGNALADAGRHGDARDLATTAAAEARKLAYPPLEAEALYALGVSQDELGESAAARLTLLDATDRAAAAHDDRLTARIWTQLVWTLGVSLQQRESAELAMRTAEAAVARVDRPPRLAGDLAVRIAARALVAGEYAAAETAYRRGLALLEPLVVTGEVPVPRMARARAGLAAAIASQARYREAAPLFVTALAETEAALGPDHPGLAGILSNLGLLYDRLGRPRDAAPLHERALALTEHTLGPDHPSVVNILNNVSSVKRKLGDLATATSTLERALAIERLPGRADTDLGYIEASLASILAQRGRLDEAMPVAVAARAHLVEAIGADHPDVSYAERGIAEIQFRRDRWSDALAELARAEARTAKVGGTLHAEVAVETARALLGAGRSAEALRALDRCLAELATGGLGDTPEAAAARLWRGVARAATGDVPGGRVEAEAAFTLLTALGQADQLDAGPLATALGDLRLRAGDAAAARTAYRQAIQVLPPEHIDTPAARLGLAAAALALSDRAAAWDALQGLTAHPAVRASPSLAARLGRLQRSAQ